MASVIWTFVWIALGIMMIIILLRVLFELV
jgi:hypothetical protein